MLGQEVYIVIILICDAKQPYKKDQFPDALLSHKNQFYIFANLLISEETPLWFKCTLIFSEAGHFLHVYFLIAILLQTGSFLCPFLGICLFLLKVGEQTLSLGLTFAF